MAKPSDDDIELELAEPDVCDDDGDELREPTADEMALLEADDDEPVELTLSGFEKKPVPLPQPDRARSSPDLPRVKSNAFKRFIS